jgi:hypothetical protein
VAVFSLGRIAVTAVACALVAGLVLAWRYRHRDGRSRVLAGAVILLVGVLVLAWRLLGNAWRLNDDFLPGISVADLGGGVVAGLALLALAPLRPGIRRDSGGGAGNTEPGNGGGRDWLATSGLVALAVFIANVVFI